MPQINGQEVGSTGYGMMGKSRMQPQLYGTAATLILRAAES